MKRKIISLLIGALVLTSLSTTAFASTNNTSKNGTIKVGSHMTQEQVEKSKAFLTQHPDLITKYNELKNNSNPLLTSLSAAAPLSSYYTLFVACNYDSSTGTINNYEMVKGKSTTDNDFNGTIYVGTMEVGYGADGANFNGTELNKYDDVAIDVNGDKIVDEFIDVWKINNVTSGKFTSTCNSYSMNRSTGNWPSYTTSINIK